MHFEKVKPNARQVSGIFCDVKKPVIAMPHFDALSKAPLHDPDAVPFGVNVLWNPIAPMTLTAIANGLKFMEEPLHDRYLQGLRMAGMT